MQLRQKNFALNYLYFSNCLFNIKIPNPIRFYCVFNGKIIKRLKFNVYSSIRNIKYLNIKETNKQTKLKKILQKLLVYDNIACNGLQLEAAYS